MKKIQTFLTHQLFNLRTLEGAWLGIVYSYYGLINFIMSSPLAVCRCKTALSNSHPTMVEVCTTIDHICCDHGTF